MYSSVCVFCLLFMLVFKSNNADDEKIELHITEQNNTYKCAHTIDNPIQLTVYQYKDFKIQFIINRRENRQSIIYYLLCRVENDTHTIDTSSRSENTFFVTAYSDMAGTWNCTILTDYDYPKTGPRITYIRYSYAYTNCFIKVHVRLEKPPQIILVNNMILPSYRSLNTYHSFDHYAQYNYLTGDVVDVWCIPELFESNQTIQLDYSFAAKLDVTFEDAMKTQSDLGLGFRTVLGEKHHRTTMICTWTGPRDVITVQVMFVQNYNKTKDIEYIKINETIARKTKSSFNSSSINKYEFDYMFFENEYLDIVFESQEINRSVMIGIDIRFGDKKRQRIIKKNNGSNPVIFTVYGRYQLLEIIYVDLKLLSKDFKEKVIMDANIPPQNIVLELYNSRLHGYHQSWIYYEFNEGDVFMPNCSVNILIEAIPVMVVYKFNGSDFEPTKLKLTSDHDKMVFECSAKEMSSETETTELAKYYKRIYVLFRLRANISTTTTMVISTTDASIPTWSLALIIIVVGIVLGCISVFLYKIKRLGLKSIVPQNLQRRTLPSLPLDHDDHQYEYIGLGRFDSGVTNSVHTSSGMPYDYAYNVNLINLWDNLDRPRAMHPEPERPTGICTYAPMNPKIAEDEYIDVNPESKMPISASNSRFTSFKGKCHQEQNTLS